MNTSGEAADQVMRMMLNGAEVLIKLSGSGAKNAAVLLCYSEIADGILLRIARLESPSPSSTFDINSSTTPSSYA